MGSEIDIGFALVMEAFDKFDQAAGRIITAQPAQMTQAAANLEHAREGARAAIKSLARDIARSATRAALPQEEQE